MADVPGAGTQDEWLRNRREFPAHGYQYDIVLADAGRVLGYGAAEQAADAPPAAYRLFVVTRPEYLGDDGLEIYEHLERHLLDRGAAAAWFVEYAQDRRLVPFILGLGYVKTRRIQLASAAEAVVLSKTFSGDT